MPIKFIHLKTKKFKTSQNDTNQQLLYNFLTPAKHYDDFPPPKKNTKAPLRPKPQTANGGKAAPYHRASKNKYRRRDLAQFQLERDRMKQKYFSQTFLDQEDPKRVTWM